MKLFTIISTLSSLTFSVFSSPIPVPNDRTISSRQGATVIIDNHCQQYVYMRQDTPTGPGFTSAIPPNDNIFIALTGVGNALKFSYDKEVTKAIEFDFSVNDTAAVFYAVSDAAGHPFDLSAGLLPDCAMASCPGETCGKTQECATSRLSVKPCQKWPQASRRDFSQDGII